MGKQVEFTTNKEEVALIEQIATRVVEIDPHTDKIDVMMDVSACHANGCRLKLQALLDADNFNFLHDINGIYDNLDRTTGQLMNCFLPRFAE